MSFPLTPSPSNSSNVYLDDSRPSQTPGTLESTTGDREFPCVSTTLLTRNPVETRKRNNQSKSQLNGMIQESESKIHLPRGDSSEPTQDPLLVIWTQGPYTLRGNLSSPGPSVRNIDSSSRRLPPTTPSRRNVDRVNLDLGRDSE